MGLDISFHSKIKFVTNEEDEEGDGRYDDHVHVFPNPDFPDRAAGLEKGYYETTPESKSGGFRAGSYSGYNAWRSGLAQLVSVDDRSVFAGKHQDCPFHDLIMFSDCEGAIGPAVSAKLSATFKEWRDRAQAFAGKTRDAEWFMRVYDDFAEAFEAAADGGVVSFH